MSMSLGISSISEATCRRRLFIYIKSRERKLFWKNTENKFMIIGKIIHSTFQIMLTNYFSTIQYYYHREKKTLLDSIKIVLDMIVKKWYTKLLIRYREGELLKSDFMEIIAEVRNQVSILAEHSTSLINEINNNLVLFAVDDEFNVSFEIAPNILLTGKVDLVCYDHLTKTAKLIELKTGKPNSTSHNKQIRLYGEIFKLNFPQIQDVILELWYTKPGEPKRGFSKIKKLRKYQKSELDDFSHILNTALKCNNLEDLPPRIDFPGFEKICDYCEFCNLSEKLFKQRKEKKEKQRKLDSFF